jgi:hypothetical protein
MLESTEMWFWFGWSIAGVCLLVSMCLRVWLVHVLTTKYPALYIQLGSPAFVASWMPWGRTDLISALKATPSGTLGPAVRRIVESIHVLYVVGRLSCLALVALVVAQALST